MASAGSASAAPPSPAEVERALGRRYGKPEKPRLDPLDELVLTILSQNTTDRNRDQAWSALRDTYADWDSVRKAPRAELEETIRTAGLAGQKATAIRSALERLTEERGRPTLDHLEEMGDEEALEYLSGFHGVGVKTAACVLCFSLRRPVMPVDTHVLRVSRRLGLVPPDASATSAHETLNRRVAPRSRFPLHVLLIRHGRAVCTARSPACESCVLREPCPRIGVEPAR